MGADNPILVDDRTRRDLKKLKAELDVETFNEVVNLLLRGRTENLDRTELEERLGFTV